MELHGIVRAAELVEDPPESGNIELVLRVQGVGPGQPRRLVVPLALLVADPDLDPETVQGRAFRAEVAEESPGRWAVRAIGWGERSVLRRPDDDG